MKISFTMYLFLPSDTEVEKWAFAEGDQQCALLRWLEST